MNELNPELPKILVIDDDPISVRVLCELFKRRYQVSWASDGCDGLVLAQETLPDLILLDVLLPGIDGYEVCRRLRVGSATADIPVIFLTAMADAAGLDQGFEVEGPDYLCKPFDFRELLARVSTRILSRQAKRSKELV